MKEHENQNTVVERLVSITCDKCGLKSKTDLTLPVGIDPYFDTIKVHWGYGSKHDLETWEYDLCEKCLEDMFKELKEGQE